MLSILPWAVAWWLHWRWMRAESMEADGPAWIATVDRLDAGVVALVGLATAAGGAGGLIGLLIDIALGGNRADGDLWRREAANFIALAFVGGVLWLWNWARLQGRRAAAPEAEAQSTVRRSYLLLVVAVSVLVGLGTLAYLLYRLFNAILQVGQLDNATSAISAPLGAFIVAAALAIYHGLAERRDRSIRSALQPVPETSTAAAADDADAAATPARRTLVLSGPPGTDLEITVAALRAALSSELSLEDAAAGD
jgi:hypothetical protein